MQHQPLGVTDLPKGIIQHRHAHQYSGRARHFIGHDFLVIQVQHRREADLLASNVELRDIRGTFPVGAVRPEASLQPVGRDAARLSSLGAVALGTHPRFQAQLAHQLLHGLVIEAAALTAQSQGDAPGAVAAFVSVEDALDTLLLGGMGVQHPALVVGAACQPSGPQQVLVRMVMP